MTTYIETMTQEELAFLFEEWKRRYDADPNAFQSIPDFIKDPPQSYGEGAARYFLWLIEIRDEAIDDGVFS